MQHKQQNFIPTEPSEELTSDFNEAKYQLYRLHESWTRCKNLRRQGQLLQWKWELDEIWDELSAKVVKRGDKETPLKIIILDSMINYWEQQKNPEKIYEALKHKQQFLKWVQEDVGMGGRMSADDDGGLDV